MQHNPFHHVMPQFGWQNWWFAEFGDYIFWQRRTRPQALADSRGRVAGGCNPPSVGKFYLKKVIFLPFLGLQPLPPFQDRMVDKSSHSRLHPPPLFKNFVDPPFTGKDQTSRDAITWYRYREDPNARLALLMVSASVVSMWCIYSSCLKP